MKARYLLPLALLALTTRGACADDRTSGAAVGHDARVQAEGGALRVEFQPAEWPNVMVRPSGGATAWDWSGQGSLALEVSNPDKQAVEFGVRIDDDPAADGVRHCRSGRGSIEPGATATFVMTFAPDPMSVGMRGLPSPPGSRALGCAGAGPFALSHIVAYQVFLHRPGEPSRLTIRDIRLLPPVSLSGIVNEFGQYAKADWPGKLHSEAELLARAFREPTALRPAALPDRDKYGGWAAGPTLAATGFFRTAKHNGKWALVTPDGHLFISLGMDCVNGQHATFVTGREAMFAALPKPGDPLEGHFGYASGIHSGPVKEGRTFDFFGANLERRFGQGYEARYYAQALDRLRAWGFNTVGNWSDARLYGNGRVPYVVTTGVGGDHARVSSGSDYWARMHDPFDPKFAEDAARAVDGIAPKVKDDPWCLGWFVDNELSWAGGGEDGGRYGLAYGALSARADRSPAKRAFLKQLQAKYGDIAKFNAAWGENAASWEALEAPFKPAGPSNAARKADMSAFVKEFARQYFRVVRDAVRRADPNHLYLGCRFAWHGPEAVEAAAELCDVISFNIYAPRVDEKQWGYLTKLDKPCIIGEFHFGSLDRGMFHPGLVSTPNQQARAAMYRDYVGSVLDSPAFVGCHWFQYVDEPITGRTWDGENYNIGFVDVTDTPYPEMVAAAKQIHAEGYTRRFGTSTAGRP